MKYMLYKEYFLIFSIEENAYFEPRQLCHFVERQKLYQARLLVRI